MTREEASSVCGTFFNYFWDELTDRQRVAFNMAIEALKERPHGEWFGTVCTNCGESTSFYYDCNYCPQCGADMGIKGGEAE